jgi:hypothetical protein
MAKARVKETVRRRVVPHLVELGFVVMSPGNDGEWSEGSYFRRVRGGLEEVISIGRHKFGGALGLLVTRERPAKNYEGMDWVKEGLSPASLKYETQGDLERVVDTVLAFTRDRVLPWFDRGDRQ